MNLPLRSIATSAADAATLPSSGNLNEIPVQGLSAREIDLEYWDDVALSFRDVIHEQTACFNIQRWGKERLRTVAFMDQGQIVGGCLARLVNVSLTGVRVIVVRWGPMWRHVGTDNRPELLGKLYSAMREILADGRDDFLLVLPPSDPAYSPAAAGFLREAGFTALKPEKAPQRYFVDVSKDPETIRSSFSQKWRYNLKKAEKAGLTSSLCDASGGHPSFKSLYDQMLLRKRFVDLSPVESLESLALAKQPSLRPTYVVVSKGDEPVASAVIDCSGEQAIYMYGATSEKALPLRAGYLMQWVVIQHLAKQPAIRWYDLGGGSSPQCSLHQFKRGLSGKLGVIADIPPVHYYANSTKATIIGNAILQARSAKDGVMLGLNRLLSPTNAARAK